MKKDRFLILISATLLFFSLLLGPTLVAAPNADTTPDSGIERFPLANKHFLKGKQAFQKGNHNKAGIEFDKCLAVFPSHAQAHLFRAQIHYQDGNYRKAEEHIVSAENNYEKLMDMFKEIQMDKSNRRKAEGIMLRSALHQMESSYDQYDCKKGISQQMASVRDELSDIDSVELSTDERRNPVPAGYHYLHGNILYRQGKASAATEQYLLVLEADPYHVGALTNLCAQYYYSGEYERAWSRIMEAKSGGVSIDPRLEESIRLKCGHKIPQDSFGAAFPGGVRIFSINAGTVDQPNFENIYVVVNEANNEALIIDPGSVAPHLEAYIEKHNLKVRMILNTHGHRDHCDANHYYASRYKIPVAGHRDDQTLFRENGRENEPDIYFSENKGLDIPGWTVKWFHTPGHTPGSVCYMVNDCLFSGDTLFRKGIGAISAVSAKEEQDKTDLEINSIQRQLMTKRDSLRVFPGHGTSTTIGEERKNNPFLVTANHSSQ